MRQSSTSLSFSQALDAAKAGHLVRRSTWEASGLSLFRLVGQHGFGDAAPPLIGGIPRQHFTDGDIGRPVALPCLVMRSTLGALVGWLPTPADLFAEDWYILEA